MILDVLRYGIELLSRHARHGLVNEVEVVAAVKIVEDIHHRQPMSFDLRPAAEIDDPDFLCGLGCALWRAVGKHAIDFSFAWVRLAGRLDISSSAHAVSYT